MASAVFRPAVSQRARAVAVSVALIGSLFVPTVALAVGPSTIVTQAVGQADPTGTSPINFTVEFSDPVEGFTGADLLFAGSAGGTWSATVTGGPKIYNVAVTGMTTAGTVIASVPSGVAYNPADEPNRASTDNFSDNYPAPASGLSAPRPTPPRTTPTACSPRPSATACVDDRG